MAFDQGQSAEIVCVNQASTPLGVPFTALVTALQKYVQRFVVPAWGTPARLSIGRGLVPGKWGMVFLDDADVAGALAYHDLTPDGLPLLKVFVRTTINSGDAVSVSASHELVEALVDPICTIMVARRDGSLVAYEAADPVEEITFPIDNIPMSDFVFPSYFEEFRPPHSAKFDQMGQITRPFEILRGGYLIVSRGGKWTNVFGSEAKEERFAEEDRRGHRTERRCQAMVDADATQPKNEGALDGNDSL